MLTNAKMVLDPIDPRVVAVHTVETRRLRYEAEVERPVVHNLQKNLIYAGRKQGRRGPVRVVWGCVACLFHGLHTAGAKRPAAISSGLAGSERLQRPQASLMADLLALPVAGLHADARIRTRGVDQAPILRTEKWASIDSGNKQTTVLFFQVPYSRIE